MQLIEALLQHNVDAVAVGKASVKVIERVKEIVRESVNQSLVNHSLPVYDFNVKIDETWTKEELGYFLVSLKVCFETLNMYSNMIQEHVRLVMTPVKNNTVN